MTTQAHLQWQASIMQPRPVVAGRGGKEPRTKKNEGPGKARRNRGPQPAAPYPPTHPTHIRTHPRHTRAPHRAPHLPDGTSEFGITFGMVQLAFTTACKRMQGQRLLVSPDPTCPLWPSPWRGSCNPRGAGARGRGGAGCVGQEEGQGGQDSTPDGRRRRRCLVGTRRGAERSTAAALPPTRPDPWVPPLAWHGALPGARLCHASLPPARGMWPCNALATRATAPKSPT